MAAPEENLEKLKMIMPYWLRHNNEHIEEDKKWLAKVEEAGLKGVAEDLRKVIQLSEEMNRYIESAIGKLGGAAEKAEENKD